MKPQHIIAIAMALAAIILWPIAYAVCAFMLNDWKAGATELNATIKSLLKG